MSYKLILEPKINLSKLRPNYREPVGMIYETTSMKTILEFFLLDNCYDICGGHCMTSFSEKFTEPDGHQIFFCYISDFFYNCWFNNNPNFIESLFMHELGHVINKDYLKPNLKKNYRFESLKKGVVDSRETQADEFAAVQVGPQKFLMALDAMKTARLARNDFGAPIAIMELSLRIKNIKTKFNL